MKKFLAILLWSMFLVAQQASACPFCYGAKDGKSTEHMAVAIWFLFGAVMSVIGVKRHPPWTRITGVGDADALNAHALKTHAAPLGQHTTSTRE